MINPSHPDGGAGGTGPETHESFIQLSSQKKEPSFKANSNYVRLDYEKPTMAGDFQLPGNARALQWITAHVLDHGPDCKLVKKGDKVLLAYKGLVNAEHGNGVVLVDGLKTAWTQEVMIVAVIEAAPVGAAPGPQD